MKKMAAKLITISSQILVVCLFLIVLFNNNTKQSKTIIVDNNNFNKMADSVSSLFKEEEMILDSVDDSIIDPLLDEDDVVVEEEEEEKEEVVTEVEDEISPTVEETPNLSIDKEPISVVTGNLTGYGPDCNGCSGITNSGYDVSNTIYYNDHEYGDVRILAADPSFPLYSIIRVSNVPNLDSFIAIVLDRGGNVGYGKGTLFDLLFATEKDPNILSLTENVTFELLRSGK